MNTSETANAIALAFKSQLLPQRMLTEIVLPCNSAIVSTRSQHNNFTSKG